MTTIDEMNLIFSFSNVGDGQGVLTELNEVVVPRGEDGGLDAEGGLARADGGDGGVDPLVHVTVGLDEEGGDGVVELL